MKLCSTSFANEAFEKNLSMKFSKQALKQLYNDLSVKLNIVLSSILNFTIQFKPEFSFETINSITNIVRTQFHDNFLSFRLNLMKTSLVSSARLTNQVTQQNSSLKWTMTQISAISF